MGIQIMVAGLVLAGVLAGSSLGGVVSAHGNMAPQSTNGQIIQSGDCAQDRIGLQDLAGDQDQDQTQLRIQDCICDADCIPDQLRIQDQLYSSEFTRDQLKIQDRLNFSN